MSLFDHRIETSAHFDAPPHKVWAVLTDFESYGEWNPFLTSLSGVLAEGERLEGTFVQANGKAMTLRPRVLRVSPARQIRWLGRLGPGGLFDGEHYFLLTPAGDGGTDLVHGERFTGLLIPFTKGVLADTAKGFESMNQALDERVRALES